MQEFKINKLKQVLKEEEIKYIEDDLRILISLEKLYTVEGIISVHDIKVLDEVIHHEEVGGNNEHYLLVAKDQKTPILDYHKIKNREFTDIFNNTVYLKYGQDIMWKEDGSGYPSNKYIKQCLQCPNVKFDDSVDCWNEYTKVKLKNVILL